MREKKDMYKIHRTVQKDERVALIRQELERLGNDLKGPPKGVDVLDIDIHELVDEAIVTY